MSSKGENHNSLDLTNSGISVQETKMSEKEYNQKLQSLRRYVPFLVNMMDELKAKGNREAQLHKIQSLHNMITTTKKKLQVETLNKCEQVLDSIYTKVNPQLKKKTAIELTSPSHSRVTTTNAESTPASPSPPPDLPRAEPIVIPTEKIDIEASGNGDKSHLPKINIYSNVVINRGEDCKKTETNSSGPQSSVKSFEINETDKIDDATLSNATLEQLQEYRKQLQLQIEDDDTEDSFPKFDLATISHSNTKTDDENKEQSLDSNNKENKVKIRVIDKNEKELNERDGTKKEISKIDSKPKEQESSFGNILSSIDKIIEKKHKQKKDDRRDSTSKEGKTDSKKSSKLEDKKATDKNTKRRDSKDDSKGQKHDTKSDSPEKSHSKSPQKSRSKSDTHKSRSHKSDSKSSSKHSESKDTKSKESKSEKDDMTPSSSTDDGGIVSKSTVKFERISDKYNRKPKRKPASGNDTADIDKNVTDSIEKNMKASPISLLTNPLSEPKIPLLGEKIPEVAKDRISFDPSKPTLPEAIQKLLNDHSAISNIASLTMKEPIPSGYSLPINPFYEENTQISPQYGIHSQSSVKKPINISNSPTCSTPAQGLLSPSGRSRFLRNVYPATDYCGTPRPEFESPVMPKLDFEVQSQKDFNRDYSQYTNPTKLNFMPPDNSLVDNRYGVPQQRFNNPILQDVSTYRQFNQYDMTPGTPVMSYCTDNSTSYNQPGSNSFNQAQYYQAERPWYENNHNINSRSNYSRDPRNYKEYKEMKERRERELIEMTEKQKETKDPRLLRLSKDSEKDTANNSKPPMSVSSRDPRISRLRERSEEKKDNDAKGDSRLLNTSKFDQMYSTPKPVTSDAEKNIFSSPLDSLYTNVKSEKKTGLGYGMQSFRIPKKNKPIEPSRDNSTKSPETTNNKSCEPIEIKNKSESKFDSNNSTKQNEDEAGIEVAKNLQCDMNLSTIMIDISWGKTIKKSTDIETLWYKSKDFISEYEIESLDIPEDDINDNDSESCSLVIAETPMESDNVEKVIPSEKSFEPTEQNILASFFQNLLKSKNKKDKKSALCSLIETFSDSFETTEINKIRKIIRAENENNSDDDETVKDTQHNDEEVKEDLKTNTISNVVEEVPEVGSTTTDELPKQQVRCSRRVSSGDVSTTEQIENDTALDDLESQMEIDNVPREDDKIKVTKGLNKQVKSKSNKSGSNQFKVDEEVNEETTKKLEPVVESVGERIKNRRRANIVKPKKKSELDQLHDDIKEMFIRDGVLTATGKRMCRILKDDPNVLSSRTRITRTSSAPINSEISKKLRKRTIVKNKTPSKSLESSTSMKDVRVLINKIPDNLINKTDAYKTEETDEHLSEIEDGDDNDSDEDNKSRTSEGSSASKQKGIAKRLRRSRQWASGVIPKGKKGKKSQIKPKESTPEVQLETDKMYYSDLKSANRKKLKCKLCNVSSALLIPHYVRAHPDYEVMCSRLPPQIVEDAISDFTKNNKIYENLQQHHYNQRVHRFNYQCRICNFTTLAFPASFYDHCSTHTGEYRHRCNSCWWAFASSKSLAKHFSQTHPKDKQALKPTNWPFTYQFIFAYVCGECNYFQMDESRVEQHVKSFHSTKPTSIFKISLSSTLDQLAENTAATASTKNSEVNSNNSDLDKVKIQKKNFVIVTEGENGQQLLKEVTEIKKGPGPKCKTITYLEKTVTVIENEQTKRILRSNPMQTTAVVEPKEITRSPQILASDKKKRPISNERNDEPQNKKRNRSLDKLILSDNGDDLDTIITLSSRSSRAAKEKATAKLKTLMENNEETSRTRRVANVEQLKKKVDPPKTPENVKESELLPVDDISAIIMEQTAEDEEIEEENVEDNVEIDGNDDHNESDMELEESIKVTSAIMEFSSKVAHKDRTENENECSNDKMPDLTVFTCQTDIHEDKDIEEDRLRKLDEVNKIIGSRSSKLDMADRLCNRLNTSIMEQEQHAANNENENETTSSSTRIKTEPTNTGDTMLEKLLVQRENVPPVKKTFLTATTSQQPKKPLIIDTTPLSPSTSFNFKQNKSNSLFSNTIEKLQNNINKFGASKVETDGQRRSITSPSSTVSKSPETVTTISNEGNDGSSICIGNLITITRNNNDVRFGCRAKNCYVSTTDKLVFELHCKFGHPELELHSAFCEACDVLISANEDRGLLQTLYEHSISAHSNFIENIDDGHKQQTVLRMRRLSGDKLSVQKDEDIGTSLATMESVNIESEITDEDNPFSFRIANVISLADNCNDTVALVDDGINDNLISPKEMKPSLDQSLPDYQSVPPLTLISEKKKKLKEILIKEMKMTPSELTRPRKTSKAFAKFVNTPGHLYKCPHFYCMFSTNIRLFFERHLKAHTTDGYMGVMVPCVYCDVKTEFEQVPMHIDLRHAHCQYACKYCLYRACIKEYVLIHQEQTHNISSFFVIDLPIRQQKRYITGSNLDFKSICKPYICACKIGGQTKEFLFEHEFANHLMKEHTDVKIFCGHYNCLHFDCGQLMVEHWNIKHNIWKYQCAYCSLTSKTTEPLYLHLTQFHPSLKPDILVREVENGPKFFKDDFEFGYTQAAFENMRHIKKIVFKLNGNQKPYSTVKIVKLHSDEINISETSVNPRSAKTIASVPTLSMNNKPQLNIIPSATKIGIKSYLNPNRTPPSTPIPTPAPATALAPIIPQPVILNEGQGFIPLAPSIVHPNTTLTNQNRMVLASRSNVQLVLKSGTENFYLLPTSDVKNVNLNSSHTTHNTPLDISTGKVAKITRIGSYKKKVLNSELTMTETSSSTLSNATSVIAPLNTVQQLVAINKNSEAVTTAVENERAKHTHIGVEQRDRENDILQTAIDSSMLDEVTTAVAASTATSSTIPNTNQKILIERSRTTSLATARDNPPPLTFLSSSQSSKKNTESVCVAIPHEEESNNKEETLLPVEHVDVISTYSVIQSTSLQANNESIITIDCDSFEDNTNTNENQECNAADGSTTEILQDPLDISTATSVLENASNTSHDDPSKIPDFNRSISLISNSDDELEEIDKGKKKGLDGHELYRCAVCRNSSASVSEFKNHLFHECKTPGRPYHCIHCGKSAKSVSILLEHIQIHGIERFICTLCDKRFNTLPCVRTHMKTRHNIQQTSMVPIKCYQDNTEMDFFVIKPFSSKLASVSASATASSDNVTNINSNSSGNKDPDKKLTSNSYKPDEIDMIPIRQIFSNNVKCGLCNFQTKVRVNIVRHLQMHLEEASVPESVPINPVPCLEKNEKMFDKMFNMAASSLTTGANKSLSVKNEEKFPEFVATHCRFVCCAQSCSYLCPEEGNLKHHLMALHSDETEFTCAHCKSQIKPAEADCVIKHYRLHGLHLYKCHYCDFIHYLKHKVERHVSDGHLNATVKVTVLRSMEAEPQDADLSQPNHFPATAVSFTKFKPWRCCMCKYRSFTKEEMESHVKNRHEMDAQYKCTLCTFRSDTDSSFQQHFIDLHPQNMIDIISVYHEVEDESLKLVNNVPFDTTPLWQRDKPRVRHIRGILFDDSSTTPVVKATSPKKAVKLVTLSSTSTSSSALSAPKTNNPGPSSVASSSAAATTSSSSSSSKNLWECIEAVASGTADILQDRPGPSGIKTYARGDVKAEEKDKPIDTPDESLDDIIEMEEEKDVIVIESDESDSEPDNLSRLTDDPPVPLSKDKDNKLKPMAKNRNLKRSITALNESAANVSEPEVKVAKIDNNNKDNQETDEMLSISFLKKKYGNVGTAHSVLWQCPKCQNFKTKTAVYFMFHLFKDFEVYRYKCKICHDFSITRSYMQVHVNMHPDVPGDIVEVLPRNPGLEKWVRLVIREQSLQILAKHQFKLPNCADGNIKCVFCDYRFTSMNALQLHTLKHWAMIPYQCKICHVEFYSEPEFQHHHKIRHPNQIACFDERGATLDKAIEVHEHSNAKSEQPLKRPMRTILPGGLVTVKKKRPMNNDNDSVKNADVSGTATTSSSSSSSVGSSNSTSWQSVLNDTSINSGSGKNRTEFLACDLCAWISDTESEMTKHTTSFHGMSRPRYHILDKKVVNDRLACNVCDKVLPELLLRRHFLDVHFQNHSYFPYKYRCGSCTRQYLDFSSMTLHFKRYHPDMSLDYFYLGVKMQFNLANNEFAVCQPFACTMCTFTTASFHSMRLHLKIHFRPISCNICKERFKFKKQAISHHGRQHQGQVLNVGLVSGAMELLNKTLDQIKANCIQDQPIKNVARKSTSAPHIPDDTDMKEESDTDDGGKSIEDWMKIYNLNTYVDLSDCKVD